MRRRRLPIGLQTFSKLREADCYYVDKTACLGRLIDEGTHYFLSRPRRFGKSLLLDTVKELFEGNEALFTGLHIHNRWDWSVRHPVLRLDFGSGDFRSSDSLHDEVMAHLDSLAEEHGVTARYDTGPARFRHLIQALHRKLERRVVVLVDEYDKPILDTLENPGVARAHRDYLRGLYAVIKTTDAHVRFAFVTGVSRFSKVNLFSGLNNLKDVTLDPRYYAICGYTESDLDTVFAAELASLNRERIRDWYNGYNWRGTESVYNPFDVLLLFDTREFAAHWFETATPTFLVDTLIGRRLSSPALDGLVTTGDLLSSFDVEAIAIEALLFQTGYLTIKHTRDRGGETQYRLGYPNREVRQSLNRSLLRHLVQDARQQANSDRLYDLLAANDFTGMEALFHAFFSSIPYEWYTRNAIARYEGYYASVFYSYFAALGLDVTVEDSTSHGRADMAVRFGDNVYLFEFKVVELASEGAAMSQLKERRYADKHRAAGVTVYLVAVEFSRDTRNVVAFDVERA